MRGDLPCVGRYSPIRTNDMHKYLTLSPKHHVSSLPSAEGVRTYYILFPPLLARSAPHMLKVCFYDRGLRQTFRNICDSVKGKESAR